MTVRTAFITVTSNNYYHTKHNQNKVQYSDTMLRLYYSCEYGEGYYKALGSEK